MKMFSWNLEKKLHCDFNTIQKLCLQIYESFAGKWYHYDSSHPTFPAAFLLLVPFNFKIHFPIIKPDLTYLFHQHFFWEFSKQFCLLKFATINFHPQSITCGKFSTAYIPVIINLNNFFKKSLKHYEGCTHNLNFFQWLVTQLLIWSKNPIAWFCLNHLYRVFIRSTYGGILSS